VAKGYRNCVVDYGMGFYWREGQTAKVFVEIDPADTYVGRCNLCCQYLELLRMMKTLVR